MYFYPRSPCGERPELLEEIKLEFEISIHALLAESDLLPYVVPYAHQAISIHALLAESDPPPCGIPDREGISIHALLAESDSTQKPTVPPMLYFYPRSPCGERLLPVCPYSRPLIISIHALLAESDPRTRQQSAEGLLFLSTLSLRRATW